MNLLYDMKYNKKMNEFYYFKRHYYKLLLIFAKNIIIIFLIYLKKIDSLFFNKETHKNLINFELINLKSCNYY